MSIMKEFKLDNELKIESGFKIPERYFENFSEKVIEQLPKNEPKVISIFPKRNFIIMMVAAVLVLALMIPVINNYSTKNKELDETTLENYLTYETNINQYDLINILDTKDIAKIKTTTVLENKTIEDFLTTNADVENLLTE